MIDLLIPLEIPSQNESDHMHWSKRHKMTKLWETWIRYAMRPNAMDCASGKRSVHIHAFRKRRITDASNLHGGAKYAVDAIKRCGLLIDDSDKWVTLTYEQSVASKSPTKKPCTRITIEDVT